MNKWMKVTLAVLAVALVASVASAVTVTNGGQVITVTLLSEIVPAVPLVRTYTGPQIVLIDTNAVTDPTGYTPADIGAFLIGKYGLTSNGVWIAVGNTTNNWEVLAPVTP